jgi:hypothetical protein
MTPPSADSRLHDDAREGGNDSRSTINAIQNNGSNGKEKEDGIVSP